MGAGAAAWVGPAIQSGAAVINGAANIWGGNLAADAARKANSQARTDLSQGYTQGMGYQQPAYDIGKSNLTDLSSTYGSGGFSNPHMDPYHQDPNAVFQDPEYQAQMRAGTEAINSGAQASGDLFSGRNDRNLTQFGQDTFAGRSDALYNRGFNATNTAFNQNAQTNANNFNMGNALAGYGVGAGNKLTDLSVMQGGDLANNDLANGQIRINNINGTTGQLVNTNSTLANQASKGFENMMGGGFMPKSSG